MTVTGSPLGPFALAVFNALKNDASLAALATGGVHAQLPSGVETPCPYVVIGRRTMAPEGGTVVTDGNRVSVWLDVWSDYAGPGQAQQILSRIRAVLHRAALEVPGYRVTKFSITCREEHCFRDTDPELEGKSFYHGVQEWTSLLEEAA